MFVAKVLEETRKFPAVLLPLPLGEVASRSDDGEGARRCLISSLLPSPTKSLAYRRRVRYYILYTL